MTNPPRIAVLVSGSGRSLENLEERVRAGELACRIGLVLSDRPEIGALQRAVRLGIETVVVERGSCADAAEFGQRVFAEHLVDELLRLGVVWIEPEPVGTTASDSAGMAGR